MPALLIRCRVDIPVRWPSVLAEWTELLRAGGACTLHTFANSADRQEIIALWNWDTLDRAWLFAQSDALHALLVQAGTLDQPEISILEEMNALSL